MDTNGQVLRISPPDLIVKVGAAALGMLAVFLFFAALKELKEYKYVGSGVTASNTITVTGMSEVFAVPDIATFSVTIQEEATQVEAAQTTATEKSNDVIAYLQQQGVEEKDIQTTDYSVSPQYDYIQETATDGVYRPGRQVLRGYQVSQTLTVKVRDTDKAGELLSGVGSRGVSYVSGLSFTIDDEDALKAQAREEAIAEANEKADELAGQLGVSIIRVVGFYEDSYGIPYYGKGGVAYDSMSVRSEAAMAAPAPNIPTGENKITSNVNITYEIR